MYSFIEHTVGKERSGKSRMFYGAGWFISVFFLICGVFCATGILGQDAQGNLQIGWPWIILLLVCIGLAAMAFYGKDFLYPEYDYSITGSVVDVSRVLNNRRRKHLAEFSLGKVISCGEVSSEAYSRARSMCTDKINNWFIHGDAPLYYFCHEQNGKRSMCVLELNQAMVDVIKNSRELPMGAWHEGKR